MTPPQIAVWGASGVGKTMYLTGAMLALATFHPDWSWMVGGEREQQERSIEFINSEIGKLQGGRMAGPTDPSQESEHYVFKLQQQGDLLGRSGRYHEISLVDVAGVSIEDGTDRRRYFETLRSSQGILMLIDPNLKAVYQAPTPQRSELTYFALISLLIKHLQEVHARTACLEVPIAVCLTKVDQDEHWPYRKQPKQYLQETLGVPAFNLMTNAFIRSEFFAISTVGRYHNPRTGQEGSNLDPHPDRNQLLDFKAWKPYRLLDPMFWLLDQLERERDSRLPWWRRSIRRAVRQPNYQK